MSTADFVLADCFRVLLGTISPGILLGGTTVASARERRSVGFLAIVLLGSYSKRRWTGTSTWDARGEPWFYRRLGRPPTGLRLFRVLREGLGSVECLSDWGWANDCIETASRTHVPDDWSHQRGSELPRRGRTSGISALAPSASLDRRILPFSRDGG